MAIIKSVKQSGIGMTSLRTRERMIARLREQGIQDEVVLSALVEIPRHEFVDEAISNRAYEDVSLPIGHEQTISQPYIVAKMSELLRHQKPLNKVLEVGTGCGYQTAILSKLAKEVFSVERIRALVLKSKRNLQALSCVNVKLDHADGHLGLPGFAPFDGIIVTAAASHIPQALLDQLDIHGRLVIPVGTQEQILTLVERTSETEYQYTKLENVKFVPLIAGVSKS